MNHVELNQALLKDNRIFQWFLMRGLSAETLARHLIGWNGKAITIPVMDVDGEVLFTKYRRSPFSTDGPKYWFDAGATSVLYNSQALKHRALVVCEGELDCLRLEEEQIPAVTSSAGALTFKPEWALQLTKKVVFVCMDHDAAGRDGARRIADLLPQAKVMVWPDAIGEHGDVTDFFTKLGGTRDEFLELARKARPLAPSKPVAFAAANTLALSRAKQVPLVKLLGKTLSPLRFVSCPFHTDATPSMKVFPDNHYHCFSCGKHGDAIDLLRELQPELSFTAAVKQLSEM